VHCFEDSLKVYPRHKFVGGKFIGRFNYHLENLYKCYLIVSKVGSWKGQMICVKSLEALRVQLQNYSV